MIYPILPNNYKKPTTNYYLHPEFYSHNATSLFSNEKSIAIERKD